MTHWRKRLFVATSHITNDAAEANAPVHVDLYEQYLEPG